MGARKSIAGENVTINLALWKSSQTFKCRRCVNGRASEDEKGDAIYFQFCPNDVPRNTKRWGKRRKNSLRDQTRESRVTKLGIRFPFILVCMLLVGFCDLLRLANDNYPRHRGCFVMLLNATLHLALDPLSSFLQNDAAGSSLSVFPLTQFFFLSDSALHNPSMRILIIISRSATLCVSPNLQPHRLITTIIIVS